MELQRSGQVRSEPQSLALPWGLLPSPGLGGLGQSITRPPVELSGIPSISTAGRAVCDLVLVPAGLSGFAPETSALVTSRDQADRIAASKERWCHCSSMSHCTLPSERGCKPLAPSPCPPASHRQTDLSLLKLPRNAVLSPLFHTPQILYMQTLHKT